MIDSKQINSDAFKGLGLEKDEISTFGKRIQKIAEKVADWKIWEFAILRRIDIIDDISYHGPKVAFEFFVNKLVRIITFSQFRYQLKNGIDYFKIGYQSHDFDSCYALEDFCWKLKRLAKIMQENNRHVGDKSESLKIEKAISLFGRVMSDDYLDEFEKEVSKKYGESIRYVADSKDFSNMDKGPFKRKHVGCMTRHIRENWTPELDKEIDKAEREMYKKADRARTKEWKEALKIIEKNFFRWWD